MLGANTNRTYVRAVFCAFAFFPQYVLKPTFTKQHIAGLDKQGKLYRAYDGTTYLPGIVGLNNIKANDYANVVLQVQITAARCFSRPGRDIGNCGTSVTYFHCFRRPSPMSRPCGTTSWKRKTTGGSAGRRATSCFCWCRGLGSWCVSFGIRETSRPTCLLMRCCRPWCCAARKTSKSPSKVKVKASSYLETAKHTAWGMQMCAVLCCTGDAVDFMMWFLNALHGALGGTKKKSCE